MATYRPRKQIYNPRLGRTFDVAPQDRQSLADLTGRGRMVAGDPSQTIVPAGYGIDPMKQYQQYMSRRRRGVYSGQGQQQPQLSSMIQQQPQQPTAAAFRTPAPQPQQPKPKYDWQQPQMGIPTPEQRGGEPYGQPLLPGQPLPPTQQFGYRQPLAQRRQGLNQPYSYGQPQFGGLSQYFNY